MVDRSIVAPDGVVYRWRIDTVDHDSDNSADEDRVVAVAAVHAADRDTDGSRGFVRLEFAAIGAFVATMFVVAVAAVIRGWTPVSDEALIELRVRDVPSYLPLVGVWSRFGWNHPGPGLFYYLRPFYWLSGNRSVGLMVAMIVLHTLFVVGAWMIVRRIDRSMALALLVAGQVLLLTSEPWALRNPWNPYVAIVGGLVLFAVAWSFAERRGPGAVLLFPIGSFLVQAHAVMAPMVVGAVVAAVVGLVTCRDRSLPRRRMLAGVVITVIVWIPPLIEQLTNRPGNLRAMLHSQGTGEAVGLINTIKIAFAQTATLPGAVVPEVVRARFLPLQHWSVPVWMVVFAIAVVVVTRARNRTRERAFLVASGLTAGAFGGVVVLSDGPYSYLAIGTRVSVVVLAALSCVVIAGRVTWFAIGERGRIIMAVVSIVLSAVLVVTQVRTTNPLSPYERVVDDFADIVVADGPPSVIEVRSTPPSLDTMVMAPGLVLALEKRGYDVRSPMLGETLVGAHRARQGARYVVKVAVPGHLDDLVAEGWKVLAVHEPLTDSELAEIDRLRVALLDHPVDRIDSVISGQRPRMESEIAAIEKGRPSVALVVRWEDGKDRADGE